MKIREDGMPDEELWVSFFDPEAILKELNLKDVFTVFGKEQTHVGPEF